eukprot:scaffold229230_cov36-Tisochrysis_lutea.AAC.1
MSEAISSALFAELSFFLLFYSLCVLSLSSTSHPPRGSSRPRSRPISPSSSSPSFPFLLCPAEREVHPRACPSTTAPQVEERKREGRAAPWLPRSLALFPSTLHPYPSPPARSQALASNLAL